MNESEKLSSSGVRIVLFGSEGGFSRPVLEQLLTLGLNVTAVVITDTTDSSRNFPVAVKHAAIPGGLAEMAAKNKVDILWAQKLGDHKFINPLTEKRADIFLVACFSQKILCLGVGARLDSLFFCLFDCEKRYESLSHPHPSGGGPDSCFYYAGIVENMLFCLSGFDHPGHIGFVLPTLAARTGFKNDQTGSQR